MIPIKEHGLSSFFQKAAATSMSLSLTVSMNKDNKCASISSKKGNAISSGKTLDVTISQIKQKEEQNIISNILLPHSPCYCRSFINIGHLVRLSFQFFLILHSVFDLIHQFLLPLLQYRYAIQTILINSIFSLLFLPLLLQNTVNPLIPILLYILLTIDLHQFHLLFLLFIQLQLKLTLLHNLLMIVILHLLHLVVPMPTSLLQLRLLKMNTRIQFLPQLSKQTITTNLPLLPIFEKLLLLTQTFHHFLFFPTLLNPNLLFLMSQSDTPFNDLQLFFLLLKKHVNTIR